MGQRWPPCIVLRWSHVVYFFTAVMTIYFAHPSKLHQHLIYHRQDKPCGYKRPQIINALWNSDPELPTFLLSDIIETHLPPLWFSFLARRSSPLLYSPSRCCPLATVPEKSFPGRDCPHHASLTKHLPIHLAMSYCLSFSCLFLHQF